MMGFKIKKTVNGETVWEPIKAKKYTTSKITEYTGTFPITINANGDALLDYRIYGADGGVGVATESGETAGYKLPMMVRSLNLIDASLSEQTIEIKPSTQYNVSRYENSYNAPGLEFGVYDENDNLIWSDYLGTWHGENLRVFDNAKYFKITIPNSCLNAVSLVEGIRPPGLTTKDPYPENYIPYQKITIPVYIGENQLTEGEYVSYGEQKIYKYMIPENTGSTVIYGFHINPDEPNSYNCVTYLNDAVGMTPAAMGTTAFNYGSWENVFFMPKPCMLKFDGTVDYYLDPNDYSKKADGITPSDYNNLAYQGNAMMEFPLIWYKYVQGTAEGEGYFYVSNHKVDNTYKCWSNMDCDGNIIEHFYMPIYNGCTYDGKMRSISGLTLAPWSTTAYSASATYAVGDKVNYNGRMWQCTTAVETAEAFDPEKWEQFAFNGNTNIAEEIAQATANNTSAKTEWYIDQLCDRVLINGLLVLISKSIDTQGVFGRGIDSNRQRAKESYVTGSLDDKGMFYGSTANGSTAVKVFGMENWWGLVWHRTAGLIGGANNVYLYKMTFSTADGSIVDGYNTSGTGYLSVGGKPTTDSYIKKMQFGLFGFLPIEVSSYQEQYYKDLYYNGMGFAFFGGNSGDGQDCGAFCLFQYRQADFRIWYIAAMPSCKPLAKLFPTDPPVPLPEILTMDGTTVIDYDGDPKPSQMYIKYNSWSGWSDIDNYKMVNGNWTQEVT